MDLETLYSPYFMLDSNWFVEESQKTEWSREDNKKFESALAIYDKDTPDRWLKIAEMIPGKTVYDVIKQYRELEDVCEIEAGNVPIPGYLASSFTFEVVENQNYDGCKRRHVTVRGSDHERKKGVPWTEEEHRQLIMFEKKKKIEEISSSMVSSSSSNVHLPYLFLGSEAYLIDDASISSSLQRHKPINTDMISNLPDNVLIHILSFLSIKNAIKTSILSKKWRYLWTYLSVFDFRIFYLPQDRNPSYSLLDAVATLLQKSNHHLLEIKRLTIHIPQVTLDAHKVTSLVTSLLSLKVQHLQFSIDDLKYLNTSCVLPRGFSASYSLSKLTLNLGGYTLYISNGIQFPSLKTLDLSYATFANDESVEEFFSGCPLLEELTLNNCYWLYIKQITIAISTLRILTIRFDPYCLNCVDFEKFSVKIDAVNLLSLTCTSDPTIQFVIVNPPISMVNAYIALSSHFPFAPFAYRSYLKDEEYVSHCAVVLLSGLASVKSLTLSNDTFMESPYGNDHFHLLPEFDNLTHLCLDSKICSFRRTSFTKFILKCPKLEVLDFPLGIRRLRQNDDQGWKLIRVPCCIKSSLKKLHITNFDGYACEINFVEFFLENATVLEEFQISLSCSPIISRYNWKNLADLKNRFVGMGSCDIKFRSAELVIRRQMLCRKCHDFK